MAIKPDTIETIRQWGIKSISSRVVAEIEQEIARIKADTGQVVTNGQMIERIWDERKNNGLVSVQRVNPVDDLVRLASAGPWTEHNPMPNELRRLINAYARAVRGGVQPAAGDVPKQIQADPRSTYPDGNPPNRAQGGG